MRIAKFLSRYGVCSRREAERCIDQGRVSVNGKILDTPATIVDESVDKIMFDGNFVNPSSRETKTKLWLYNKPIGIITSHSDPEGRPTVIDAVKEHIDAAHVITVGRLDINSEGLLLLTNNGELSRFLELPATGWKRRYRVKVHGRLNEKKLESLKNGCRVDGINYGPIDVTIEKRGDNSNHWLVMSLKEGKNREIRKVMKSLDLAVSKLMRTAYGPFQIGALSKGAVKVVPESVLKDALGNKAEELL